MSEPRPRLIEIGTEELPVRALRGPADALRDGVVGGLRRRGVGLGGDGPDAGARSYCTPRRLAVHVPAVATSQPVANEPVLGPAVAIARDADGEPTPALLGFARKAAMPVQALVEIDHEQGPRYGYYRRTGGGETAQLLHAVLAEAVRAMPIPRPMRWGGGAHAFARPVHWLVVLFGDQVVDAELFGIRADRMSRGHRFHHDKPVWIGGADDYVDTLRSAHVLADPDERRERIREGVEAAARRLGGEARIDPANLEDVNALVEWPRAVACGFDAAFLELPYEALVATMETHQKFFPVLDAGQALTRHFIGVANIESRREEEVARGYERVIRPRFADARFFFEADLEQGLAAMNDGLAAVSDHKALGSLADKVARVAALAAGIAARCGVDSGQARRAAELSKADLQSRLVGEFPELQGIAGRYYAAAAGESEELAAALDEAYMPRHAGDAIAPSPLGRVLAVAERLDTLAGGFAAGLRPTGNRDPFALRRNALGLARTLIEGRMELPLPELLDTALEQCSDAIVRARDTEEGDPGESSRTGARAGTPDRPAPSRADDAEGIHDFILDRLRGYYADRDVPAEQFEAVLAVRPASLLDFDARLRAIAGFAGLPEAAALAAANKRIRNILRKADDAIPDKVSRARLREPAEVALSESLDAAVRETADALERRDYVAVLSRLAWLRAPVDAFFDEVMVMDEDPALRENRLALLQQVGDRFGAIAAIDRLHAG